MRRFLLFLIAALLITGLCACSAEESVTIYTVTQNGVTFTVNTEKCTISDGTNTYQYAYSGN